MIKFLCIVIYINVPERSSPVESEMDLDLGYIENVLIAKIFSNTNQHDVTLAF